MKLFKRDTQNQLPSATASLPFEMEVGHVWICGGNIAGLYHNQEFIRLSNGKIQPPCLDMSLHNAWNFSISPAFLGSDLE